MLRNVWLLWIIQHVETAVSDDNRVIYVCNNVVIALIQDNTRSAWYIVFYCINLSHFPFIGFEYLALIRVIIPIVSIRVLNTKPFQITCIWRRIVLIGSKKCVGKWKRQILVCWIPFYWAVAISKIFLFIKVHIFYSPHQVNPMWYPNLTIDKTSKSVFTFLRDGGKCIPFLQNGTRIRRIKLGLEASWQ